MDVPVGVAGKEEFIEDDGDDGDDGRCGGRCGGRCIAIEEGGEGIDGLFEGNWTTRGVEEAGEKGRRGKGDEEEDDDGESTASEDWEKLAVGRIDF